MIAEPTTSPRYEPAAAEFRTADGVATRRAYHVAKRGFDLVFATCLLVFLAPFWIAAACLVAATSSGPVLFRQPRIGQDGRIFTCYKFRTMVHEAESLKPSLAIANEMSGPIFKLRFDPRTTSIGRLLRKTSIDEVPQLLNVLRGEMSIVGPRPPLPDEVARYNDYQLNRLSVKPGLTCIWQVSGRSHIDFDDWVELDLEYIQRRSFFFDLWLIVCTVPAVLTGRGAF